MAVNIENGGKHRIWKRKSVRLQRQLPTSVRSVGPRWRRWKRFFEFFLEAKGVKKDS